MGINGIYTILQATSYPARSAVAQSITIWTNIRWTTLFVYTRQMHDSGECVISKRGTDDDDTSKETLMMTPMAWPPLFCTYADKCYNLFHYTIPAKFGEMESGRFTHGVGGLLR